jgi:hypothetical protein
MKPPIINLVGGFVIVYFFFMFYFSEAGRDSDAGEGTVILCDRGIRNKSFFFQKYLKTFLEKIGN